MRIMTTTIYVIELISSCKWIFCNREKAFELGLSNREGRKITGYQKREDAIEAGLEQHGIEPFAVLRLAVPKDVHESLAMKGQLKGDLTDAKGRALWEVTNDGSKYLSGPERCDLSMEIVPVEYKGIQLY